MIRLVWIYSLSNWPALLLTETRICCFIEMCKTTKCVRVKGPGCFLCREMQPSARHLWRLWGYLLISPDPDPQSVFLLCSNVSLSLFSSPSCLALWPHMCIHVGVSNRIVPIAILLLCPRWLSLPFRTQSLTPVVFLCCRIGSLPVGRWGTQPSSGGTCSTTHCPWCLSFREASASWAGDPPRSSSLIPSSKSTAPTSSSLPPWEVGGNLGCFLTWVSVMGWWGHWAACANLGHVAWRLAGSTEPGCSSPSQSLSHRQMVWKSPEYE